MTGDAAGNRVTPTVSLTGETSYEKLLNLMYPVGCEFVSYDADFNPNTSWGGTWTKVATKQHDVVAWGVFSGNTKLAGEGIGGMSGSSTKTISLSPALPDANYAVAASAEVGGAGQEIIGIYGRSTTQFVLDVTNYGGTMVSPDQTTVIVYGKTPYTRYIWKRIA